MKEFFHAASDWADTKGMDIIFVRDCDDEKENSPFCMWAIINLKDAAGPYRAEVAEMGRNLKKSEKDPETGETTTREETEEEFRDRVWKKLTQSLILAHKKRHGKFSMALVA